MRVAVIGTVGIPAKYGGFETLVENIVGENCSSDIKYTVFCSGKSYKEKMRQYKGAKLEYVNFRANGAQSILYDIVSIIRAIRENDVLLILGVSGCLILPLLKIFVKNKIIVNIDGLEHRRDKWSPKVRRFLKWSEKIAVKNADIIIADNKAIQEYVKEEYGEESELIAYGGDHVLCDTSHIEKQVLEQYGLKTKEYSFSLCRIEPENNVHLILETFALNAKKLMFVGNWENSTYGMKMLEKYEKYKNIIMSKPIYDISVLNVLRSNCLYYLHGHSAGGTNPSLVEAMFFNVPIIAFDCSYNKASTENKAHYFIDSDQLFLKIKELDMLNEQNAQDMLEIANRNYRWLTIARKYESLY